MYLQDNNNMTIKKEKGNTHREKKRKEILVDLLQTMDSQFSLTLN
jgi:hypothetical protein